MDYLGFISNYHIIKVNLIKYFKTVERGDTLQIIKLVADKYIFRDSYIKDNYFLRIEGGLVYERSSKENA